MLLNKTNTPSDLKKLSVAQLPELCSELKRFVLETTAEKAGHIASSIAVTELTVALHFVFDTPTDILVWDVGHQAYMHKVITDRKHVFSTSRKMGGLSGFTSRAESEFDPFGTGHSATSISAVGGFAQAAQLQNVNRKHIAVIGDGALTGGMAYEALNYIGATNLDVLVVLNDNESSIDPNVGALHQNHSYKSYFESLGWQYAGAVDGHNTDDLVRALSVEKDKTGPRVLHIKTEKKSLEYWRNAFGLRVQNQKSQLPNLKLYQDIFADKLCDLAIADERIVAVTPAMLSGSSLTKFQEKFPQRTFDVGIAEQHAVTFAAGLAAGGQKPLIHLYSTFAQRGFDQIIHDVALQNLPVVFALDRAGLVGEDGATHHGAFDLSFLNGIPNLQILAPMTGAELERMLAYAFTQNGPVVIRFPRGSEAPFRAEPLPLESGSFRVLKTGEKTCVVSLGAIGVAVEKALSSAEGKTIGHTDLRFLKPWNDKKLAKALAGYTTIFTAEEGAMRGGLRDAFSAWAQENLPRAKVVGIGLPDKFVPHGTVDQLHASLKIDAEGIAAFISEFL